MKSTVTVALMVTVDWGWDGRRERSAPGGCKCGRRGRTHADGRRDGPCLRADGRRRELRDDLGVDGRGRGRLASEAEEECAEGGEGKRPEAHPVRRALAGRAVRGGAGEGGRRKRGRRDGELRARRRTGRGERGGRDQLRRRRARARANKGRGRANGGRDGGVEGAAAPDGLPPATRPPANACSSAPSPSGCRPCSRGQPEPRRRRQPARQPKRRLEADVPAAREMSCRQSQRARASVSPSAPARRGPSA